MTDLNIKCGHGSAVNKSQADGLHLQIQDFTPHQLCHTFYRLLPATNEQSGYSFIPVMMNIYPHPGAEHAFFVDSPADDASYILPSDSPQISASIDWLWTDIFGVKHIEFRLFLIPKTARNKHKAHNKIFWSSCLKSTERQCQGTD